MKEFLWLLLPDEITFLFPVQVFRIAVAWITNLMRIRISVQKHCTQWIMQILSKVTNWYWTSSASLCTPCGPTSSHTIISSAQHQPCLKWSPFSSLSSVLFDELHGSAYRRYEMRWAKVVLQGQSHSDTKGKARRLEIVHMCMHMHMSHAAHLGDIPLICPLEYLLHTRYAVKAADQQGVLGPPAATPENVFDW